MLSSILQLEDRFFFFNTNSNFSVPVFHPLTMTEIMGKLIKATTYSTISLLFITVIPLASWSGLQHAQHQHQAVTCVQSVSSYLTPCPPGLIPNYTLLILSPAPAMWTRCFSVLFVWKRGMGCWWPEHISINFWDFPSLCSTCLRAESSVARA